MPSTILHLFLPDRPRDGEGRSPARQLAHLLGPEASGLLTLLEESDTALTFCAQAEAAPARAALRTLMEAHLPQLPPELYMIQAYPAPEEPAVHRNDAAEAPLNEDNLPDEPKSEDTAAPRPNPRDSAPDDDNDEAILPDLTARTLAEIDGLVGMREFKELAHEIVTVAPQVRRHGSYRSFASQTYLFVCNEGDGLTTCLKQLCRLLDACELFQTGGVQHRLTEASFPYPRGKEGLKEPSLPMTAPGVEPLICLDISEWMGHTGEPTFRRWLMKLMQQQNGRILAFHIPYVEQRVLQTTLLDLADLSFVRPVVLDPHPMDELVAISRTFLEKNGFTLDEDADSLLEQRILAEKSDGHFYGMNTLSKMAHEMIYRKLLYNSRHGLTNSLIQANQVSGFVPAEASATAAEMLAGLAGLENVRSQLNDVVEQIVYARQNGMSPPCIHMRFVGSPGTGKTTVARILGKMLKEAGVLRNGGFVEIHGRDLCGQYVGHTAPRTESFVRDALGSVLFVDEAYSLFRQEGDGRDFGQEAIDTLITCMENYRDDLVVIFAGYPDEMDRLMKANAGLADRMPYEIRFANYGRDELCRIFLHLARVNFECSEAFCTAVQNYFDALPDKLLGAKGFSNARFVRNLYERTWGKALTRSRLGGSLTLTPEDLANAGRELSVEVRQRSPIGFGR